MKIAEKLYVFVQLLQKYVRVKRKNICLYKIGAEFLEGVYKRRTEYNNGVLSGGEVLLQG